MIVGELLVTVAVIQDVVVEYGAPIGNPEQILAWSHREAVAGHLHNILLLAALWLFVTILLAGVTVLRLRLEPALRNTQSQKSIVPDTTTH